MTNMQVQMVQIDPEWMAKYTTLGNVTNQCVKQVYTWVLCYE